MSSLMFLDLHVSDTGIYSKDCDGMFVLNKSQIQRLFRNHTKSFAIKWLLILDKVLGCKEEKYVEFSGYTTEQDIVKVMYYYSNIIEFKYYYDNFKIRCPEFMNSDISTMLLKLLNLPWICYIPVTHRSVVDLIKNHAVNSAFVKLGIRKSAKLFVEKWVFRHYGNQSIVSFTKYAEETINAYLSIIEISDIRLIDLSPVVSELEIITTGLLGTFSEVNNEQSIIIPQSYEISTRLFDSVNDKNLF